MAADTYLRLNAAKTPIATVEDNGSSPALDAADLRALLDGKTDTGVDLEIADTCKVKVTFDELVFADGEKSEVDTDQALDVTIKQSDDGGLTFGTLTNDSTTAGTYGAGSAWGNWNGSPLSMRCILLPADYTVTRLRGRAQNVGGGLPIAIYSYTEAGSAKCVWTGTASVEYFDFTGLNVPIGALGGYVLGFLDGNNPGTNAIGYYTADQTIAHLDYSADQYVLDYALLDSSFADATHDNEISMEATLAMVSPVSADNAAECNQAKLEVVASAEQTVAALGLYLPINEEDGCEWQIAEVPISTVEIPAAVIGAGAGAEVEVDVLNPSEDDALAGSMLLICPDTAPMKEWGVLADAVSAQHSARLRYGASQTFICKKWNWLTGVCSASAPEANTADCGCGCSGYECEPIVLESDWVAGTTITIALSQVARVGCGMLPRRFGVVALLKNRRKV